MMSPHRCLCGFFAVDHPFMDADSRISTSALSASIAASMATAPGYRPAGSTRRLPIAHESARHGKDEVGVGVVHLGQEFVYRLHRDVGPALKQLGTQVFRMVPAWMIADSGSMDRCRNWGHRDPLTGFQQWAEQG
jgi:hypothetical protein